MNFFKIKRIAMKMDGTITAICAGCEVTKMIDGWCNEYHQKMTPLFNSITNELVGFFNAEVINVEFEE
ncbi:MAG: hypothetical protein IJD89_00470 [Clostridia bacterium]|nr:hypothetical protein [Clostridia bacterium]